MLCFLRSKQLAQKNWPIKNQRFKHNMRSRGRLGGEPNELKGCTGSFFCLLMEHVTCKSHQPYPLLLTKEKTCTWINIQRYILLDSRAGEHAAKCHICVCSLCKSIRPYRDPFSFRTWGTGACVVSTVMSFPLLCLAGARTSGSRRIPNLRSFDDIVLGCADLSKSERTKGSYLIRR